MRERWTIFLPPPFFPNAQTFLKGLKSLIVFLGGLRLHSRTRPTFCAMKNHSSSSSFPPMTLLQPSATLPLFGCNSYNDCYEDCAEVRNIATSHSPRTECFMTIRPNLKFSIPSETCFFFFFPVWLHSVP